MSRSKTLWTIFLVMFKIGLFTFGGGYAMISLLENEFVEKRKVIDKNEFFNMLAIGESSPGPIAINNATYIGYKMAKFWGSLVATIAVCLPSLIIIYLISLFFAQFLEIELVAFAFKGIQVCVAFLILSAGFKLFKNIDKKWYNYVFFAIVFGMVVAFSLFSISFSVIFYILIGGVLGVVIYYLTSLKTVKNAQNVQQNINQEGEEK